MSEYKINLLDANEVIVDKFLNMKDEFIKSISGDNIEIISIKQRNFIKKGVPTGKSKITIEIENKELLKL